jgi:hypothetical protein
MHTDIVLQYGLLMEKNNYEREVGKINERSRRNLTFNERLNKNPLS